MTIYDYHVTMKRVRIADLKANLSRHLHYVRKGHVVTVLDRDTAVAQLVPYQQAEGLRVRQPLGQHRAPHEVPLPPPLHLDLDPLELLREERQPER
jgi:antitoxin (DNA-binding transcriptional repressor) of toxin-antitoxin stability system